MVYELYPNNTLYNQFQQWLHCSLTNHASHHLFPYLPRSLYHIGSKHVKKLYPQYYNKFFKFFQGEYLYIVRIMHF